MLTRNPHITLLAETFGLVFPGAIDYRDSQLGMDAARQALLAFDAAPPNAIQQNMILSANAGIPAFLTNYLDPELTRIMTTPCKAAEIFGEQKKGDWVTLTTTFPVIESEGEVSSYGDDNENGSTNANVNYVPRQSYHYQTFTRWGDRQLEMAGLAKIDWAAEQNIASALIFNKVQNKSYFYGISGLTNYGFLNDPSLPAAITPVTKTGTGSGTFIWANGLGSEIFKDIQSLYKQLQLQLGGNLEMSDKMTLAMSPLVEPFMLTAMSNVYGSGSVEEYVKKAFPNLTVKTAVEYSTTAGELLQLIVESVQGQKTGYCAFTEKMRAHAVVRATSSTHQKKSGGTWGGILKIPAGIASMIGV